jgi:hypothetical protein
MRISESIAASKTLDVVFDSGSVLHVVYRPSSYTIAEMEEMASLRADAKNGPARIIKMVQDLVQTWDLEGYQRQPVLSEGEPTFDDAGNPVTEQVLVDGQPVWVPVDVNDGDAMRYVPTNIFRKIIDAVKEDQKPSGEA